MVIKVIQSTIEVEERMHQLFGQIASELWFPWQLIGLTGLYGESFVATLAPSFLIGSS